MNAIEGAVERRKERKREKREKGGRKSLGIVGESLMLLELFVVLLE
jgi:hypothetical protein